MVAGGRGRGQGHPWTSEAGDLADPAAPLSPGWCPYDNRPRRRDFARQAPRVRLPRTVIRSARPAQMPAYRYVNIVLIGTFNPAIFQPEWFRTHDLLPEAEVNAATSVREKMYVANDAAMIDFGSVKLEVITDRWAITTDRPDWFTDIGSLVTSIFDLLSHTPVKVFGANFIEHWPKDRASADDVVKRWLPLEPLAKIIGTPVRLGGSVHSEWEGYRTTLWLEPSTQLKGGIFATQNYELTLKHGVPELLTVLRRDWEKLLLRAKSVTDILLTPPAG